MGNVRLVVIKLSYLLYAGKGLIGAVRVRGYEKA